MNNLMIQSEKKRRCFVMKTKKNQIISKVIRATAKYYANVTCPLFTYQPKVGDGIKGLRIKGGKLKNEKYN